MGDHFLNLQPGTIVNGRYEIVKCLGTGSMGMVYACRHRELAGHIVAMKVLFAEVARDEVAAARFRNEIVASYGVSHPNVVRAYEYFRDGDLIAFTMEFIGGGDLADRISANEDIPIDEIVNMLCQMASGVQAIHDAGIIHRDLKPENILLTSQGGVKITDFGIARIGSGPKLTEHGGVVGTIDYVSPEYLERGQVDARSDIYALGVLAYEMITSESPFRGKSVIESMTMRLRTDPEAPDSLRPDCPVALSNIVLKAMAREPEERYQSGGEMLEDLEALKKDLSVGVLNGGVHSPAVVAKKKNEPGAGTEKPNSSRGMVSNEKGPRNERQEHTTPVDEPSDATPAEHYSSMEGSDVGTLKLGAKAVSSLNEEISHFDDPFEYLSDSQPLESVLSRTVDVFGSSSFNDAQAAAQVSVSHSSLSTERIKELSTDLYRPGTGVWKMLFSWLLVFAIGFGVGLAILRHLSPQLFGQMQSSGDEGFLEFSVDNE